MKKKTYLLMALSMVSMGMNAQNSEKSSLETMCLNSLRL